MRLAYLLIAVQSWFTRPIRLGVRMILLQEGKVLLVRHTYMSGWHMPGGAMNRWETPLEAAAREAREEAGAELLAPPQMVGIVTSYHGNKSNHVATYVCRKFRLGPPSDRWEIAESRFFGLDELPPQLGHKWHELLHDLAQAPANEPENEPVNE